MENEKIPVKYVGIRKEYTDGAFGTGFTFVKGETKMVTQARAVKMLEHPGVYVHGELVTDVATDVSESAVEDPEEADDKTDTEQLIQDAKDSIMNMTNKAPIVEFAARNFSGVELNSRHTIADLQNEAIQMIDQYGLV